MPTLNFTFRVTVLAAVLLTFCATAATEEWSTAEDWNIIYQVRADGKGGCAVFGVAVGGYYIAWYDKHGDEIYNATIPGGSHGIYSCTKKTLSYSRQGVLDYEMVTVDRDGVATTVSQGNTDFLYTGIPPYQVSAVQDKKGYFVTKLNKGTSKFYVTRYSHK
jgi:hypothetical protein